MAAEKSQSNEKAIKILHEQLQSNKNFASLCFSTWNLKQWTFFMRPTHASFDSSLTDWKITA